MTKHRTHRVTNFYVLLTLKGSGFRTGLPCFVEARTRRIAIKIAKRASRQEPGRWVTEMVMRYTAPV